MCGFGGVDHHEISCETGAEGGDAAPLNGQPAACLRTVWTERADDEKSIERNRSCTRCDVVLDIGVGHKKMKHRSVVPDVVGARGRPRGDVGNDPVDLGGVRIEVLAVDCECTLGDIEDRNISIPVRVEATSES